MGYAPIAFTGMGDLAGTGFPMVPSVEDQYLPLQAEIDPEYCFEGIIGKSRAIQKVLQQVAIVAATDATVLLHGETGTGKELVANAIHTLSSRRGRAFVRTNCAG